MSVSRRARLLLLVHLASGCGRPECTDAAAGPFADVEDEALRAVLARAWAGFGDAIAPDRISVAGFALDDTIGRGDAGVYNSVTRRIRISPEAHGDDGETLRHELCHAWDVQVEPGLPPEDVFSFASEEWPWSAVAEAYAGRRLVREAFAFTCQIDPSVSALFAADRCGVSLARDGLDYLAARVYRSVEAPVVSAETLVDVRLPFSAGVGDELSLSEEGPGTVWVVLTSESGWVETARVDVAVGAPSVPPEDGVYSGVDGASQLDGGALGAAAAGVFRLDTPMGMVDAPLARRAADEPWATVDGACTLAELPSEHRSWFVADGGAALWVGGMEGDRLVVQRW